MPNHLLNDQCNHFLNCQNFLDIPLDCEYEYSLDDVLAKIKKDDCGRLVVPILWNKINSNSLGKNFNLAKSILLNSLKKYSNQPEKLLMIDQVFQEQIENGIVEKIDNLDKFMDENKNCSFLAHMPVFRLDEATTKCRNVFLSNLPERSSDS